MPEMLDVVTLTAISSDWGNDIRDRTVQRYSSVANRTTEHPTPSEGDLAYLEDSNTIWVYDGAAWKELLTPPIETADIASVPVEFGGATESVQDQTLTTTYENGASVTFTKPASWTSYKIMAWGSVTYINNAAGVSLGESRILIDGNAGTTSGPIASAQGSADTSSPMVRHERTGLTGNAVVVIQYRETANDMWKSGSCVNYTAVRTT